MTDIFSPQKRSEIMSRVKSKNTKPEIIVRTFLFSMGFRYRKNDKRYAGVPDILLPKYKTAIFVHGCFWHGHTCAKGGLPTSRTEFWKDKIARNKERDAKNIRLLENSGFHVIIIWECELKNKALREDRLIRLVNEIRHYYD
ncbi:very short patch repair endonuclease [Actinobacillus suis]|uniref:Very short patch repair endonuclease n=2 Tax=Actinobacillus suis TaxID=716 RepID=K0G6Q7_ACTSU|nr:DNA mismatch endonuclease Vsr [Actinobacillus suis]AFU19888.1 putative DNA mismatch endonuclease [Actinobacillus suis H91-0380]AIJ32026.1 putative DNA mismatch endonuclease [Actinobacillus suis ATCC 33415]OQS56925.1 very short patch repair endonuclease [Actinobacillus suis]OQS61492.1 very short patch repair endonuclease [Actinobacillus suis]OQS61871.1 very short patch repair endonuclease [Actinobacillus suis]